MTRDEGRTIVKSTLARCLAAVEAAVEEGGFAGLCVEGRLALAADAVRALSVERILDELTTRDD